MNKIVLCVCVCVGDVQKESRHLDQSTVRQGTWRLKMFLNLMFLISFLPHLLFYYLHNYLKYKTLLFRIHSMVFNHIFRGDNPQMGGILSPLHVNSVKPCFGLCHGVMFLKKCLMLIKAAFI